MPKSQHLKVDVQNRSGFNLSHENILTLPVGTLVPVLVEEALPNSDYDLRTFVDAKLAPMATDFYGRVSLKIEAFFCPNRILWGSWGDFIKASAGLASGQTAQRISPTKVPVFTSTGDISHFNVPLMDYMGYKRQMPAYSEFNALPFLAYHRIWDEYYRNKYVQTSIFQDNNDTSSTTPTLGNIPWWRSSNPVAFTLSNTFADSTNIMSMRKRNYMLDYFTAATPNPLLSGNQSKVEFTVDAQGDGNFTIAQLRSANALQKFLERNNLSGYDEDEIIRLQFGKRPVSATYKRPIYLGSTSFDLYNHSVNQTEASQGNTFSGNFTNPLAGSLASEGGKPCINGQDKIINNFHCSEHGYIIVLASIVPIPIYGTGERRYLEHVQYGDFAWPMLAGVGDQPIYSKELSSNLSGNTIFGYTERYAEYRFHPNEVHGLLNDGQSLEAFAIKRTFTSPNQVISNSFLRIPDGALDEVGVYKDWQDPDDPEDIRPAPFRTSQFGAWCDFFFDFRAILPLPEYSIPTLEGDSDTHKIDVIKGGTML